MNSMNSKYLKPEFNTPYTVALKFTTPLRVNGWDGWQFRYMLADGRALYLPESFRPQMDALNLQPGQSFIVEKRAVGRKAEWSVSLCPRPSAPEPQSGARRLPPQSAIALINASEALDAPVPPDPPRLPPTRLESALETAVAAAAAAEKHAEQLGYSCRFSSADIRALGISAFIDSGRAA